MFQETSLYAPIPHGMRGPVAEHQQALPHLSRGHRDAFEQRCHILGTCMIQVIWLPN